MSISIFRGPLSTPRFRPNSFSIRLMRRSNWRGKRFAFQNPARQIAAGSGIELRRDIVGNFNVHVHIAFPQVTPDSVRFSAPGVTRKQALNKWKMATGEGIATRPRHLLGPAPEPTPHPNKFRRPRQVIFFGSNFALIVI